MWDKDKEMKKWNDSAERGKEKVRDRQEGRKGKRETQIDNKVFRSKCFDGLVSLFNGISTFVGYLMSNPS